MLPRFQQRGVVALDRLGQPAHDPRDRPIATVCASGYRSSVAASLLRAAGFERVSAVTAGVPTWEARGYPLEHGPGDTDDGAELLGAPQVETHSL